MANNIVRAIKSAAYQVAVAIGAAGTRNRARTIPSKKDKANDPKRQRKQRDWLD